MTPDEHDQAYTEGSRTAWRQMLAECVRQLDYDDPAATNARWIQEREETVAALRSVCEEFGDNDWGEQLHLADVIEKHLARHLHNR